MDAVEIRSRGVEFLLPKIEYRWSDLQLKCFPKMFLVKNRAFTVISFASLIEARSAFQTKIVAQVNGVSQRMPL